MANKRASTVNQCVRKSLMFVVQSIRLRGMEARGKPAAAQSSLWFSGIGRRLIIRPIDPFHALYLRISAAILRQIGSYSPNPIQNWEKCIHSALWLAESVEYACQKSSPCFFVKGYGELPSFKRFASLFSSFLNSTIVSWCFASEARLVISWGSVRRSKSWVCRSSPTQYSMSLYLLF